MARKLRIEYPGAIYHAMSRGNRGDAIFRAEEDRKLFLKTLGQACEKTGWLIHAFVLMGNHYHLLLETPEANLVAGMKWLQGTYTQCVNARHRVFEHLSPGRRGWFLGEDSFEERLLDQIKKLTLDGVSGSVA